MANSADRRIYRRRIDGDQTNDNIRDTEGRSRAKREAWPHCQDDLVLLDSGLDSLCFAILVARLEDELGVDPFRLPTT